MVGAGIAGLSRAGTLFDTGRGNGERTRHCRDIVRNAGIIGWGARNNAKPDHRTGTEAWVIQATAE